jgi:O-antigen/teichoic acid export membrane protein
MSFASRRTVFHLPRRRRGRRRHVGRSVAYLTLGEIANKLLRFAATLVFAHRLAVADFGRLNVAIALGGLLVVGGSLGLPDIGSRDVAVAPRLAGLVAGRVLAIRLTSVALCAAISIVAFYVIAPAQAWLLALAALISLSMAVSADWICRGLERMRAVALASAAGGGTVLLGSIVLVSTNGTVTQAALALVAGELAIAAICWWAASSAVSPLLSFHGGRALLRRSIPVAAASVIVYSYYANVDTIVIAVTRSEEEAGIYSAPYRLFLALNLLPVFTAYAALPSLARAAEKGKDASIRTRLSEHIVGLTCYGAAVVGVAELSAPAILSALFGSEFRSASATFLLLAVAAAWYAVGFPAGYSLIARNRSGRYLAGAAVAGTVGIGLDLALIPAFGVIGAGVATMCSFLCASLVWLWTSGVLSRLLVPVLALSIVSVGGCLAAAYDRARVTIGLLTLALALAAGLLWSLRTLRQAPRMAS